MFSKCWRLSVVIVVCSFLCLVTGVCSAQWEVFILLFLHSKCSHRTSCKAALLVLLWLFDYKALCLFWPITEILPTSLQGTLGNIWTYFSRSHFDSTPETRGYWPQWVEAGVAAKVLTLPYNVWDRPTTKNQSAADVSSAMVGKPCPRLWIQKAGILFCPIIQLWCNAWSRAGTPTICWMGSCMNMLRWRTRHCQWTFCRHAYLAEGCY